MAEQKSQYSIRAVAARLALHSNMAEQKCRSNRQKRDYDTLHSNMAEQKFPSYTRVYGERSLHSNMAEQKSKVQTIPKGIQKLYIPIWQNKNGRPANSPISCLTLHSNMAEQKFV